MAQKDATEYLLSSEENRKRLLEAMHSKDSVTFDTLEELEKYSNKLLKENTGDK
ncbi:hypothetical protein FACS1894137_18390 [Spirochaetia bacterium]|nr:hypothetical protein FACS1894137_18390 [Spirochaetia bacterium]